MTEHVLENPVAILLVEDNEIDVEAVERAFRKANIKNPLHKAHDGIEALDLLRGNDGKVFPQPFMIVTDINMPRMGGFQLLKELRGDAALRQGIIFVLTTSGRGRDRLLAYEQNVAGYFLKENLDILVETLKIYCRGNKFPDPGLPLF